MNRAGIYLLHDRSGRVDDYVLDVLDSLEPFLSWRLVVANGALAQGERDRLLEHCDAVLERPNEGYDVGGYHDALERIGWDSLSRFDELVLMNNTFFAPIRPWAPVFEEAEKQDAAFWGLTDHAELRPHPFLAATRMPRHIQSHFIAVRRELLEAAAFREYWERMPPIRSYRDSIAHHESRFTSHFAHLGFRWWTAFAHTGFSTGNPSILEPIALMEAGCPILKRRVFFHDPVYMAAAGVDASEVMRAAEGFGFASDRILAGVVRTSSPRSLWANARLTEVLGERPEPPRSADPLTVHAHVTSAERIEPLLSRISRIPSAARIILSCPDPELIEGLEAQCARKGLEAETRLAPLEGMPSLLALFTAAPESVEEAEGLVLDLGEGGLAAPEEPLLASSAQLEAARALFRAHPNLGVAMPMPPESLGESEDSWRPLLPEARGIAGELRIGVPLDERIPLAPGRGPVLFRPVALRRFALEKETLLGICKRGSDSMRALMMLIAYEAAESGHHCRYLLPASRAPRAEASFEEALSALAEGREDGAGTPGRGGLRGIARALSRGLRRIPICVVAVRRVRALIDSRRDRRRG